MKGKYILLSLLAVIVATSVVTATLVLVWVGDKEINLDNPGTVTTDLQTEWLVRGQNYTYDFTIYNNNSRAIDYTLDVSVIGGTGISAFIVESWSGQWVGTINATASKTLHIQIGISRDATSGLVHYQLSQST